MRWAKKNRGTSCGFFKAGEKNFIIFSYHAQYFHDENG
jgi:hypothetical protein